ncbi:hypothetical protein [Aquimarina sp. AU58]|uniref:hypothetical protein n=1 Tax=Aquimarina sp. AU58 TaxID=1874112 RepID=UPI000D6E11CC|nr:hypothetical protein [Aquimarina sp. AU58]
MITTEQKTEIINTLGKNHLSKILSFLSENNMEKEEGVPYSRSYIYKILSGEREHSHIESLIFKLAYDTYYQNLEEKKYREDFLKLTRKNVA